MIALRTYSVAALLLPLLACDGVLDLRDLRNPPDGGAAGATGTGGRGGSGNGSGGVSVDGGRAGTPGGAGAGVGPGPPAECVLPGLVAYYPFNVEGYDHSGNGHNLLLTAVAPAAGMVGGGFAFNGTTSLARVGDGSPTQLDARTFCAWVKPESVTGLAQPLFGIGSAGQSDLVSLISSTLTPGASCTAPVEGQIFHDHAGDTCAAGTGLAAPSGVWSFVCYASDVFGREQYVVNGNNFAGPGTNYFAPLGSLTIGSSIIAGGSTGPAFRGVIDEVTIWNRALSLSEMIALQNSGGACALGTGGVAGRAGSGAAGKGGPGGAAGAPGPSIGIPLVPDGDGHYDGSSAAGVVGYWWSTGDGYGTDGVKGNGPCAADGFPAEDCSVLTTPDPSTFFRPDPSGRGMCASGVSAQVMADSTGYPAYSAIWGNIIGFDLADPGGLRDGVSMRGPYDALAHGMTGFAFDIDTPPAGGQIRVTFQTVGTELNAAYWGGATANLSPITGPGHYEIRWAEVGGPMYLSYPPPFDPSTLVGIGFHVVSNTAAPVPFDFCVSNVKLLTDCLPGTKAKGAPCGCSGECSSRYCVDGVCCESACTGGCQTCAGTVPGLAGTCVNRTVGSAPRDPATCFVSPVSTCGSDGACDGVGGCRKYPVNTVCKPGTCDGDAVTGVGVCDGIGQCKPTATRICFPFSCNPGTGACFDTCTASSGCASPAQCVGGSCGARMNGAACTEGTDCASRFCADGVCCNVACSGACISCNLMGREGTCWPLDAGAADTRQICRDTGPATCGETGLCDGVGGCQMYPGGTSSCLPLGAQ